MNLEQPKNKNYCAIVVKLKTFVELPNCSNVKAALIFSNSIIVGKDAQEGELGIYFPAETKLSKEFLGANNLFRKTELGNVDPDKKGFFEEHGRVKAMKFRGHKSEGFYVPISFLSYTGLPLDQFTEGMEFDQLEGKEICGKYVPRSNRGTGGTPASSNRLVPRLEDKIVEGQFRFHIDTENLRRNIFKIYPNTIISISDKWHGTSAIYSRVLVNRVLSPVERLLKWFGVNVSSQEYGLSWSSRRVLKSVAGETRFSNHFYGTDVWGEVAAEIGDNIPKGYTVYGEIVGFTADGKAIQKGYSYGCEPGKHKFVVYRVTSTNVDGKVLELGWTQLQEFCSKYGLDMVKPIYHGRAKDLLRTGSEWYADIEQWQYALLNFLEGAYVYDQDCVHNPGLPAEGIVVRVDGLDSVQSFKLKNFRFLQHETTELDTGEIDMETAESEDNVLTTEVVV